MLHMYLLNFHTIRCNISGNFVNKITKNFGYINTYYIEARCIYQTYIYYSNLTKYFKSKIMDITIVIHYPFHIDFDTKAKCK